ncbi:hypothetical protein CVT24_006236 [Panaeolus cyanescens]|uniref:Uncharacterized protein n=1 Tax=Panaeolus cyanescens TaxID=181874 RepID=A0A409YEG3_9AGAR|nr:hypothetical protein CVT24_006236 [Panaeolus cyanescens]
MSITSVSTKPRASWSSPRNQPVQISDWIRALDAEPDTQIAGAYDHHLATSQASRVAPFFDTSNISSLPHHLLEKRDGHLRTTLRAHKASSSRPSSIIQTPLNGASDASGHSPVPQVTTAPVIPETTPPQGTTIVRRNYFGIAESQAPERGGASSSNSRPAQGPTADGKEVEEGLGKHDHHHHSSNKDEEVAWMTEKRRMEKHIDVLIANNAHLLSENGQLKQRFATSKEMLVSADQQLTKDEKIIELLNLQVASLRQADEAWKNEKRAMVKEKEEWMEEKKQLVAETERLRQQVVELQQKTEVQVEVEKSVLRMNPREADEKIQRAEEFFATEDKLTCGNVVRMVEMLNEEIFQASAYMAGLVEDVPKEEMKRFTWNQCISPGALGLVEKRIGPALMAFIESKGPENRRDPLALQLAFQAILVWWSAYMVNDFCDESMGHQMATLYKAIRKTGSV